MGRRSLLNKLAKNFMVAIRLFNSKVTIEALMGPTVTVEVGSEINNTKVSR